MKELEKYFMNPKNIMDGPIFANSEKVTPEIFFEMNEKEQENVHIVFNHIKCKDWFSMSVQASYGHYCEPRITLFSKHSFIYETMEVWYPSEKQDLLMPYCAQETWEGVYWQVPIEILNKIIEKHGGIKAK